MLEKQNWMKYAPDILTEWQQMKDEGKDVDRYRQICEKAAATPEAENAEEYARMIFREMKEMPVRADYPFAEPSLYEEIAGISKGNPVVDWRELLSEEALYDKVAGAWVGRISGCLLGKPFECLRTDAIMEVLESTGNYPMERYADSREFPEGLAERLDNYTLASWRKCWIDRIEGKAPVDDDTNYTVLALKLIEEYGTTFRPNDVLEAWLYWMPMFAACTAERAAYRNAAMGMYAPETAIYNNPYREWIGAQIRGDFFGYINPGNPGRAAEMAWRDASISHVKNGIYGEMFVAAMIAEAAVCGDGLQIIKSGLNEIPPASRLAGEIHKVLVWYQEGLAEQEVFGRIHSIYDEYKQHDWCHTNSNAMIVAASLLYGRNDFAKSVCLAVQAGFDTDCNAATVGSIVGMILGNNQIPEYWGAAFNRTLRTSIAGYYETTVEELAEKTVKIVLTDNTEMNEQENGT